MTDEKGQPVAEADCPVLGALQSGVQSLRRLAICGRSGRTMSGRCPRHSRAWRRGRAWGAILLLHDASSEISLERRCQSLHEKATRDPLTQVANRAEFDRVHALFVEAHRQQQVPCSLLMCDLDHFKSVNDNYGHQAGDEAIKQPGDAAQGRLPARRSGRPLWRRGIRRCSAPTATMPPPPAAPTRCVACWPRLPQPSMNGRHITVSFGVTEIQPGDTPETMLRRADRALLMAKSKGRNMVVQLGTAAARRAMRRSGPAANAGRPDELIEQILLTPVPLQMAIEKFRGFVADHRATILKIEGNRMELETHRKRRGPARRPLGRLPARPAFRGRAFAAGKRRPCRQHPAHENPRGHQSAPGPRSPLP